MIVADQWFTSVDIYEKLINFKKKDIIIINYYYVIMMTMMMMIIIFLCCMLYGRYVGNAGNFSPIFR